MAARNPTTRPRSRSVVYFADADTIAPPVTGILMIDTSVAITPRNRHALLTGHMLIGSSASTGPIPAGESCVSQHLRGIAVVTCFSVEQVRGPLTTSGDGPENHQFRREVSIVCSAGDRQAGRPW